MTHTFPSLPLQAEEAPAIRINTNNIDHEPHESSNPGGNAATPAKMPTLLCDLYASADI